MRIGLIPGEQAMEEIHKLRAQISRLVQANFPSVDAGFTPKLQPPSDLQVRRETASVAVELRH
jgi:hypothetical protein